MPRASSSGLALPGATVAPLAGAIAIVVAGVVMCVPVLWVVDISPAVVVVLVAPVVTSVVVVVVVPGSTSTSASTSRSPSGWMPTSASTSTSGGLVWVVVWVWANAAPLISSAIAKAVVFIGSLHCLRIGGADHAGAVSVSRLMPQAEEKPTRR
jgi:hypothetical protein